MRHRSFRPPETRPAPDPRRDMCNRVRVPAQLLGDVLDGVQPLLPGCAQSVRPCSLRAAGRAVERRLADDPASVGSRLPRDRRVPFAADAVAPTRRNAALGVAAGRAAAGSSTQQKVPADRQRMERRPEPVAQRLREQPVGLAIEPQSEPGREIPLSPTLTPFDPSEEAHVAPDLLAESLERETKLATTLSKVQPRLPVTHLLLFLHRPMTTLRPPSDGAALGCAGPGWFPAPRQAVGPAAQP
jgi:hypothetical protein